MSRVVQDGFSPGVAVNSDPDELQLIRDGVRSFVEAEMVPYVDAWEEAGDFPRELFAKAGETGLFGLKFEERWGGTGPNWHAEGAVTEELSRARSAGVANALGSHKDLGCHYVHSFGSDAQRERILPDAILGRKLGCLAVTEPDGGSDVAAIRTRAVRTGAGWRLNGQKTFITNGDFADFLIVAAKTEPDAGREGISLFIVETPVRGMSTRRLSMLGWKTSHTCEIFLDDCEVPFDAVLGAPNIGFRQLMSALEWERVVMALGAIAAAGRALEDAVAYAKQRRAFGRTILANQVWQHRFADCWADLEAARALAWQALEQWPSGVRRRELPAMAKLVATRTATRVADEVVQVYGGYGYSAEYPAQRFFRDARLGPIGGGTSEMLRQVIAAAKGLS
jgi:acyl-CoA dehydrogenase